MSQEPVRASQVPSRGWAWAGVIFSTLYLLNPTAGFIEFIPDNFPVIGNLDEIGATVLLVQCVQKLRKKKPV